mmetsp:Transcript_83604/g.179244  ORF Transcript_83604/g.179244 Transcript_83604/m.179244 type:complete len:231 (-) Transcript_83604:313-1005(-)
MRLIPRTGGEDLEDLGENAERPGDRYYDGAQCEAPHMIAEPNGNAPEHGAAVHVLLNPCRLLRNEERAIGPWPSERHHEDLAPGTSFDEAVTTAAAGDSGDADVCHTLSHLFVGLLERQGMVIVDLHLDVLDKIPGADGMTDGKIAQGDDHFEQPECAKGIGNQHRLPPPIEPELPHQALDGVAVHVHIETVDVAYRRHLHEATEREEHKGQHQEALEDGLGQEVELSRA